MNSRLQPGSFRLFRGMRRAQFAKAVSAKDYLGWLLFPVDVSMRSNNVYTSAVGIPGDDVPPVKSYLAEYVSRLFSR